ncbi:MAG: phosphoglucosamine mutase [Saprospiraceae bacterium]
MTLIKSISGIRGTIGGKVGDNFTPMDIVECTAAFATWVKRQHPKAKIITGRDGRMSGNVVSQLAINTLLAMGIDVIDLGYSTTPTVEMAVPFLHAQAGIIFTASHNPKQWNALKFLNHKGEFISAEDGDAILSIIDHKDTIFADVDHFGRLETRDDMISMHIDRILQSEFVDVNSVKQASLRVVVDCINSTGAIAIPPLLEALGVEFTLLYDDDFGNFAHNPEPLPAHLAELSQKVISTNAHMGISIDPDVDRLAFVCEDGSMFGEEYTLVAVADYILSIKGGNTVSNLSSTRALADVTRRHGGQYFASAVGEVNVVNTMKSHQAVIGGEGNGGVIVPELHYGRDAMAGIAIFLTLVAKQKKSLTQLKASYPSYVILKDKIDLNNNDQYQHILNNLKAAFANEKTNDIDGLKIDFDAGWVHFRKSNTEPIIRIYAEANDEATAKALIDKVKNKM